MSASFFDVHECEECGIAFVRIPVYSYGDQEWLPRNLWREWCSQSCLDKSAERYWTRQQERNAEGL